MVKPNNIKRDSKYMKQQKDRYGENFIGVKTPKELYKEMPRIIAELANGYIDIDTYGYIFLSNQFKQAIMTFLTDQLNLLNILNRNYIAYNTINQINEADVGVWTTITKKIEAYTMIYNTMMIVQNTSSYQPIKTLQVELNKNYRGYIQNATTI